MAIRYDRVLTLQKVPQGGFAYINSTQGISLSSGQQFFIDSVYTGFYPPVSPLSTDPNKFRKQKWLSAGLEGNSFRRYINENKDLKGIPSGLEPGNFIYFTIEPKSSLLEQGAGSPPNNARYISTLKAKPYMVVENDANRDNSYEKTPANLFTGVSGNNNFVKFHPQSAYKKLALQSMRFHPIIGNGYAKYDLYSGRQLNIQPKNHHLETFIEVTVKSGDRINYGNTARIYYGQDKFKTIASGRALHVQGAGVTNANGIYVANNQNFYPNYYVNGNNYRIHRVFNEEVSRDEWRLSAPYIDGQNFDIETDSWYYTPIYALSGENQIAPNQFKRYNEINYSEYSNVVWYNLQNNSEKINVSRMLKPSSNPALPPAAYSENGLYILGSADKWGSFNFEDREVTGAYLTPRLGGYDLPRAKINEYSKYIIDAKILSHNTSANYIGTYLRFFIPNWIFDNQDLHYFPNSTSYFSFLNEITIKERINFKRPSSSNLHQAKKINLKIKMVRDDRAGQKQKVIRNMWPVEEREYNGYNRLIEFYDEKDSDTYSPVSFYTLTGKNYEFEQNELFIYNTRPDFNNATKQNVLRW